MEKVVSKWLSSMRADPFLNATAQGKLSPENARKWISRGNALICALTAITGVLMIFFHGNIASTEVALTMGMEVLGMLVSALIFYSYKQDADSADKHTWLFATLIVAVVIGMFLDVCSWLMQGVAPLRMLNRLCVSLLIIDNASVIYQFWLYSAHLLKIEAEKAQRVTFAMRVFLLAFLVLLLVNFFWPFMFVVDRDGVFRRLPLYFLVLVSLLIVLPPIMHGFSRFEGTKREKKVAAMFLKQPLVGAVITVVSATRAAQYCGILLSIILAMGVVISGRSKRMAEVRTELNTARRIQESMLPQVFPPFPDRHEFEIYASMDPAWEVGGDFYDFFMVDDDHLAVLIADVSDKGVPAALLMMSTKKLINFRARMGGDPGQILAEVNNQLCENNESGMFVTVWMGILDVNTGVMTCANAGHEYPVVRDGGVFRMLTDPHGLALGVMPGMRYKDYTIRLRPGDAVFVYTDGIPEASNAEGGLYTMARMELALNQIRESDPESVLKGVRADVDAFVKGASQFDDLTMLCVTYRGGRQDKNERDTHDQQGNLLANPRVCF